ncbi:lycopene cyclase domain-containing protein [Lentzea aerocolonigenes]|uniref:lycopene cyclase domain-containing protein n=1 Tax=Lentzea aerocolonigenes TaxID=68170 RepID=UPI0004C3283F|nr:lycopene cyclase domain-containing protein [Lentzea aerocolonigenes]MCP2246563.1 lycopene cyclase domain-containing protein [Lentzea aerocolonigenes]
MVEEYLLAASAASVVVVLLELCVLRTGLFRRPAYWITMVIVLGFQVLVDGWLTKLDAPVVLYADWAISGVRAPWDIPVEDFLYGFAMITAVLLLWERGRTAREQA